MSEIGDGLSGEDHVHDSGYAHPAEHSGVDHSTHDLHPSLEQVLQAGQDPGAADSLDTSDFSALASHLEAYAHSSEGDPEAWTALLFTSDLAEALAPYEPPDPVDVQTFIDHMLDHIGPASY